MKADKFAQVLGGPQDAAAGMRVWSAGVGLLSASVEDGLVKTVRITLAE